MDRGWAHGKRNQDINAASDRYYLSSLVRGRLKVKMIGLALLTILGAAGSTHPLHNLFRYFKNINGILINRNNVIESLSFFQSQLQPLRMTGSWVAMSVQPIQNPGRCPSILATTSVAVLSSMTSGSSLLLTAGKSLHSFFCCLLYPAWILNTMVILLFVCIVALIHRLPS